MKKILLLISLALITSACTTIEKEYVYAKSEVIIPDHQKLDALTVAEVNWLEKRAPKIKIKFEKIKATLIANIKQLELNIRAHNEDSEIPEPDT